MWIWSQDSDPCFPPSRDYHRRHIILSTGTERALWIRENIFHCLNYGLPVELEKYHHPYYVKKNDVTPQILMDALIYNGYIATPQEHLAARKKFSHRFSLPIFIPMGESQASPEQKQQVLDILPAEWSRYIKDYGLEPLLWIVQNTTKGKKLSRQPDPRFSFETPRISDLQRSKTWNYGNKIIPPESPKPEMCIETCRRFYDSEWKVRLNAPYDTKPLKLLSGEEYYGDFVCYLEDFPSSYDLMAYMLYRVGLPAVDPMTYLPFQTEQFVGEILEAYQPIIATLLEQFGSDAAKEFAKRFGRSKCLKQRIKMQESVNEAQTESRTTTD